MIVYKVLHRKPNGRLESAISAKPFCLKYGINQVTKSKRGYGGILCFEDPDCAETFIKHMEIWDHQLCMFECLVNQKNRRRLPIKADVIKWDGQSSYGSGYWPEGTICFKQIKVIRKYFLST